MTFDKIKSVSLFLRIGLAFSFIYAGIAALISPNNWIGFIPVFAGRILDENFILMGVSIFQIALGAWLLSNRKIFYASVLFVITMFFIVIFNLSVLDVVFRDITILLAAIALALISYKN